MIKFVMGVVVSVVVFVFLGIPMIERKLVEANLLLGRELVKVSSKLELSERNLVSYKEEINALSNRNDELKSAERERMMNIMKMYKNN